MSEDSLGLGELMAAMTQLRDTYGAERVTVAIRLPGHAEQMTVELEHGRLVAIQPDGTSFVLRPEPAA